MCSGDFYCAKAGLVIELDGGQHYTPEQQKYDRAKTDYLENLGLQVIRYSNADVGKRFKAVCADIDLRIGRRLRHRDSPGVFVAFFPELLYNG